MKRYLLLLMAALLLYPSLNGSQRLPEIDGKFAHREQQPVSFAEEKDAALTAPTEVTVNIIPEQAIICCGDIFDFTGLVEATDYTIVQWITTNGTGTFSDETILEPTYYPGLFDCAQNCITIMVFVSDGVNGASDVFSLCFQSPPEVNAGDDAAITAGNSYHLVGSAQNFSSLSWYTSGDGEFSDITIDDPDYTPGPSDILNGYVELCLTAYGISPCYEVTDCLLLTIESLLQQFVDIPGGWSGLSSYIDPADPDIWNVLAPVMDDLIILIDNDGNMLWPEGGINTIVDWNTQKGYWIKLAEPNSLAFTGPKTSDLVLELNSGWNLIPVLSECGVAVTDIFNIPEIVIIKDAAGSEIFWPEKGVASLGVLTPGKVYLIKASAPVTIEFAPCD